MINDGHFNDDQDGDGDDKASHYPVMGDDIK